MAQDQPAAADTITTVTVTGSRIPQPQIEAVSPVTSVSAEEIKQTGATRIEDLLNTLPQVAGDFVQARPTVRRVRQLSRCATWVRIAPWCW